MILITTQQQVRLPTTREHIRACGGFGSYLRESKAISRLEDMLRYPITHRGPGVQTVFREGMALFAGLTPVGREKVMLELAHDLKSMRSFPFESSESTRKLTVLANFFAEAALLLPKDGNGDICNEPYIPAITSLKVLFESDSFYNHDDPGHVAAKTACLKALWDLGFGFIGFWEDSVLVSNDPVSKQFTVDMWLNEPIREGVSFEEHPWSLLRKHIDSIGSEISQSTSPKKFEFFQRMLFDEDQAVVGKTLQLLAYSTDLPEHFYGLAQAIATTYPDLALAGNSLPTIVDCRRKLAEAGDGQYAAALHLLTLYQGGLRYLEPMLQEAGAEMLSSYSEPNSVVTQDRAERISKLALVGIKIFGSRLSSVPIEEPQEDLEPYRGADIELLRQLNLQQLNLLSRMVWAGRGVVSPAEEAELENIGTVALIKIKQMEEQSKALNVLVTFARADLSVPGFRLNVVTPGQVSEEQASEPITQVKPIESMPLGELYQLSRILRSETSDENKAQVQAIASEALSRFQTLENLSMDDLWKLHGILYYAHRHTGTEDLAYLDRLAAAAIQKIKRDKLLVPLAPPHPEQMKPKLRELVEANMQAQVEKQARFDSLVPDTPEAMTEAARILYSAEGIRLVIQGPRIDLEHGYLSDYIIPLFLHRSTGCIEPNTTHRENGNNPIVYPTTIWDWFADAWHKVAFWRHGGN